MDEEDKIYEKGLVIAQSPRWVKNVFSGISKGITDYNMWTKNWEIGEEFENIEIYFEKKLIITGKYEKCIKLPHTFTYKSGVNTSMYSIGLSDGDTLEDFEKTIKESFKTVPSLLGNITFTITAITKDYLEILNNLKFPEERRFHDILPNYVENTDTVAFLGESRIPILMPLTENKDIPKPILKIAYE